jgi:exosortase D (VPLPA-CTERM-specific)
VTAKTLTGTILVVATVCLLFWQVLVRLVDAWIVDGNYSHGFLIIPIALYLVWERRQKLAAAPVQGSWMGLVLIAGGLLTLLAGLWGSELFLSRIALLPVIAGIVLFVFGWAHLRILVFPIAFLFLMIPIPAIIFNQIAFPLQLLASKLGEWAIAAVGIPVLREGNVLVLANTSLEVAEACSGIRSLVSLITLGLVYGYFMDPRGWVRTLIVVSAIPVAIVANGARVASTGMAAHWIGKEAAEGFFHEFSGWLVFIFAFVMILVIQKLITRFAPKPGGAANTAPATAAHPGAVRPLRVALVTIFLLLCLVPVLRADRAEETPLGSPFSIFPSQLGQWTGIQNPPFSKDVLDILGLDDYLSRLYVRPDRSVADLYVGYWRSQRQGDTMHSPQNCLPGAGWEPVSERLLTFPDPRNAEAPPISVNRFLIQKGAQKQLVLYWYQGRGRIVGSEYWSKIYLVLDAARYNRTDAAIVRVVVPVTGPDQADEARAEKDAISFVNELLPALTRFLPD